MQKNMELYSTFSESPNISGDTNATFNNAIALKETTYQARLANECENSNNNDGIITSSTETFLLPTQKYDNVSEVSHLSASSCETLLVSHSIIQ